MTPPQLFTSNRLEILADALAEVLSTPLASPLAEEIILVEGVFDALALIQNGFDNAVATMGTNDTGALSG